MWCGFRCLSSRIELDECANDIIWSNPKKWDDPSEFPFWKLCLDLESFWCEVASVFSNAKTDFKKYCRDLQRFNFRPSELRKDPGFLAWNSSQICFIGVNVVGFMSKKSMIEWQQINFIGVIGWLEIWRKISEAHLFPRFKGGMCYVGGVTPYVGRLSVRQWVVSAILHVTSYLKRSYPPTQEG